MYKVRHRYEPRAWERNLAIDREGYTSLAAWMTVDLDRESLIFRKFDYLSARHTLHLQSRLMELEDQLEDLDALARKGSDDAKKSLRKHENFELQSKIKNSLDEKRMTLLDDIHEKLTEYRETSAPHEIK